MTVIKERALILRTCGADMTSHGGFVWPESGEVVAPDWDATTDCCSALHGFLWGDGNGGLADWSSDAKWVVAEVSEYIDLGGKVKFPRANVIFCGDRLGATSFIASNGAAGRAIIGGTATAGDGSAATAGDGGTATAGDGGTATAGDYGTATAEDGGTATAGDRGILSIKWHDGTRYRIATAYVGENGIKANTPYRLDSNGSFVRATK